MTKTEIRKATLDDLDLIHNVEINSFPNHRHVSRETFKTRLNLFSSGFLVLIFDGKVIGFSTALLIEDLKTPKGLGPVDRELHKPNGIGYYIRSIAVHKDYWKRGFGKLLVEKQIEIAKEMGKSFFRFTASKDVEGFYNKLGFSRISNYTSFHGSQQAIWNMNL